MIIEQKKQYVIWILAVTLLVIIALFLFIQKGEPSLTDRLTRMLQDRFTHVSSPRNLVIAKETTHADTLLFRFYRQRDFQPAWIDNKGPKRLADSLLTAIREADREGLNPIEYHFRTIDSLLDRAKTNVKMRLPANLPQLMNLEILLTDAFLIYGTHLVSGRINPETIDPEWLSARPEGDMTAILTEALASEKIQKALWSLLPNLPCYANLREEMALYKTIAMKGGWPLVPPGPKLIKGDRGLRVAALSARLIASGDMLERPLAARSVFDDTLEMAIRLFQDQSGLPVDGQAGPGTVAALNIPSIEYVRKIEANMERWRWLPKELGEKYILVNIAAFSLNVVAQGNTVLNMPVVVGKDYRQTPIFSSKMTYLVLNPYWHVPPTITSEDILPEVKKNPKYLIKKNIEVVRSWNDSESIDPFTIDWSAFTPDNLPYKFRQPPGTTNALGQIKFMFPNKYDVYLHDTPQRSLFDQVQRAQSSGCIRLSQPIDLAEYVLRGSPKWTREAIVAALDSVKDYTVKLPEPIPVHIFYCTAYVDDQGIVHFREDIYNRDEPVANALRAEMVSME